MVRKKIVRCKVHFKEPFLCKQENGEYGYAKTIQRGRDDNFGELLIVEKDGQCYVLLDVPSLKIYAPVKESFEELEGRELVQAGDESRD